MTDRMTYREENRGMESPHSAPLTELLGKDSIPDYRDILPDQPGADDSSNQPAESPKRILLSRQQLESLRRRLGERDLVILTAIRMSKYLTSDQVRRLYFREHSTDTAAIRAANRNLGKLREMHLIAAMTRRVGGIRGGSGSYIWHLTEAGERLLRLAKPDDSKRRARFLEPSGRFLRHALAVAECSIQIREICERQTELSLITVDFEPDSWRAYSRIGKIVSLKPDLYAKTLCGEYEDCWFIEVDLGTESIPAILEQCRRYHDYFLTGLEQEEFGVFPLTVWIVPSAHRRDMLKEAICKTFAGQPSLFAVITPEELEPLLCQKLNQEALC